MDKIIVTDCDGVLLDWAFAFDVWMAEQGYLRLPDTEYSFQQTIRYGIPDDEAINCINRFNESGAVGFLPPFRDSQEYVKKLGRDGWKFEVISSLHIDKYAQKLRARNLRHLFGDVFNYIDCSLDFTKGKLSTLEERYKGKTFFWIEDSASHATSGIDVGLRSVIMDHPYNKYWTGERVSSWEELYGLIYDTTQRS